MFKTKINKTTVEVIVGDITQHASDAMINWTTPGLNGGDDLFFHIHREGGSTIQKDCLRVLANYQNVDPNAGNALPVGDCAVSSAGILPSNIIIHSVCPDYRGITEEKHFAVATETSLNRIFTAITQYSLAREEIKRIAFTPMSKLFIGPDNEKIAREKLVEAIRNYTHNHQIRVIKIICSSAHDQKAFQEELLRTDPTSRFEKFMVKLFGL